MTSSLRNLYVNGHPWKFGTVVKLKFFKADATAMLIGPCGTRPLEEGKYWNWWAIVLADHTESGWRGGERVTVNPRNSSIEIVEAA